ncbi:MAG: preQ(1) synthase [Bacteroidetes bacterium]|nr:preQ(1) synthase [Bacteroidota bacterium]
MKTVIKDLMYGEKEIQEAELEIWENKFQDRDYLIEIDYPEFTCLCPRSGYPDFARIYVNYIPDKLIVELKAFKLWLNNFRDRHISHEAVTNEIYDVLREKLNPRFLEVIGDFNARGNVTTVIKLRSDQSYTTTDVIHRTK